MGAEMCIRDSINNSSRSDGTGLSLGDFVDSERRKSRDEGNEMKPSFSSIYSDNTTSHHVMQHSQYPGNITSRYGRQPSAFPFQEQELSTKYKAQRMQYEYDGFDYGTTEIEMEASSARGHRGSEMRQYDEKYDLQLEKEPPNEKSFRLPSKYISRSPSSSRYASEVRSPSVTL